MTKNETELISRAQVTNRYAEAPLVAKRASYRPCLRSAAFVALLSVCACSQTQLATVSGAITDPSRAVVPGVSITIVNQGTGLKRSAGTDTSGEYRFAGLPTGNYSLRIEKTGLQSQTHEGVELTSAAEVINSQLAIANLQQQTMVSANIAAIDSTTSTSNGILPVQSLAELPLDNRTTASSSVDNTHPGLSTSLLPGQPFGMIDIGGMSLLGNSPFFPLGDFSTVYQVQHQLSRTIGRHTLKFGVEFRRLQINGALNFVANGLYTFQDLTPYGFQASSNNPALEFFLQGLPLSYVGVNPSNANSDFAITDRGKITVGVEAYNLFKHPNFGVPSNTHSPLALGGNGDAVFKDAAGHFADNAGQILTTSGTGRQIQRAGRFTF